MLDLQEFNAENDRISWPAIFAVFAVQMIVLIVLSIAVANQFQFRDRFIDRHQSELAETVRTERFVCQELRAPHGKSNLSLLGSPITTLLVALDCGRVLRLALTASPLGEQLGAGRRELQIGSGFVLPKPAAGDG
jgi:hypothetical protein